jgi:hypothetical protein
MKKVLIFAAIAEGLTGVALLVAPEFVIRVLAGTDATGLTTSVGRVTGIALIGLGVATSPGPASIGMLTYTVLVALYLAYMGMRGGWAGPLLWPAIAVHAVLALLLAGGLLGKNRQSAPELSATPRAGEH